MKNCFLLIFSFLVISININAMTFEERQETINKIKEVILNEDIISNAVEKFIIENKTLPTSLNDINFSYEEDSFDTNLFSTYSFSINNSKIIISNRIIDDNLEESLKNLYTNNTFRDNSFFDNNEKNVKIILDDDYAKHIYGLILYQNKGLLSCTNANRGKFCIEGKNIKIYNNTIGNDPKLLYEYELENYLSAPFTITSDSSLHNEDEFTLIPFGYLLIDENGKRYIKTKDGIAEL